MRNPSLISQLLSISLLICVFVVAVVQHLFADVVAKDGKDGRDGKEENIYL
jgi:hypothetical protein